MQADKEIAAVIITLERGALDRWGKGDPSGYLEISAPDVTYFDPFIEKRIDGIEALSSYYEGLRGKISIDKFELLSPNVVIAGDTAVLTYNYISYDGNNVHPWNCTEVYRQTNGQWKIIHTHWSIAKSR